MDRFGPAELLRAQVAHTFGATRWTVADLSDDEWAWEPAASCWSVRPRAEARPGWGTGEFVVEDRWPPPDPLPLTTIGWRLAHLAGWTEVYLDWTFGAAEVGLPALEAPTNAESSVVWLHDVQDRFAAAVGALGDAEAVDRRPVHYGPELPVWRIVTTMLIEHVHHTAEVGALRDLRRGHARTQPPPPPVP